MKNNIIKYGVIDIPLYGFKIEVRLVNNMYEALKEISKTYSIHPPEEDLIDFYGGIATWDRRKARNIFITFTKNVKSNSRIIVHEADHAANRICKEVGIIIDADNDEAHTYLIDYIYSEIIKIFNGVTKSKKRK